MKSIKSHIVILFLSMTACASLYAGNGIRISIIEGELVDSEKGNIIQLPRPVHTKHMPSKVEKTELRVESSRQPISSNGKTGARVQQKRDDTKSLRHNAENVKKSSTPRINLPSSVSHHDTQKKRGIPPQAFSLDHPQAAQSRATIDRPERNQRPELPSRPNIPERLERPELPERPEKFERPELPERAQRPARPEAPPKPERPGFSNKR